MGGRKRKRTRKQHARRARNRANARGLSVNVTWLEIAKGHDGLFRGDPDPVILVGCYAITDGEPRLLGRLIQRVEVRSPYPGARDIVDPVVLKRPRPTAEVLVLVIALEQDGGDDVRRIYGQLERPDFAVWSDRDDDPAPRTLDELTHFTRPAPVHLLMADADQRDACTSDKWVGAGLSVVGFTGGKPTRHPLRFHFLSPEERNDWTAEVLVSVG